MYYKSFKTLENVVTMNLKNLEDIVLDKQGLDKKKQISAQLWLTK